ncbi:MAG: peptidase C39 family protein [archaeon]
MEAYKQTTKYTSAASSLLMILNHLGKLELNKENEYKIWQNSAQLPTRASSIFALAAIAQNLGIKTKIVVGNTKFEYPNYRFKKYKLKDIEQAKFTSNIFLKKAKEKNIPIEERDFDLEEVKKHLREGKVLMLRVNVGKIRDRKVTCNYVVVYGNSNNKFLIMDTRRGKMLIPEEDMREALETVTTKGKRDKRMVIFG